MSREVERTILHVDMDAFYASVEQRDDPSIRGKPVIVGGAARRGVVSAASYEARTFGVRSAMSMGEAMRRCPHAIVVSPRHDHYASVSRQVFAIFHRFTPMVEGLSLDEAFLDVGASRALYGDGEAIAAQIKRAIREEVGLTASAGVAPSKFVAKIASDLRKPDGLVVVRAGEVREFLAPLPIERMWGMGPKSAPRAHAAGYHTLGDLARADDERLARAFGEWGPEMARLARGEDERDVEPEREAKSIGAEETFDDDLRDENAVATKLLSQSSRVAQRLFLAGLAGRGVTVKLKYSDFTLKTRSMQLPEAVSDTTSIHRAARALLERFEPSLLARKGVRLSGVSVSALVPIDEARTLFPDPGVERGRKLEAALAALRDRGAGVTRAALLGERDDDDDE
ncbi:DNA polymerase IV [Sandaracinus amylolyticus]|uniref:DNA polymerase IV n=1 Tax=Sandaracinus amylolyticus TaxID=927083 RepID=UPI001F29422B|nr:DNA polymerase IV [Sandaracinus amylolyticus]UJR78377.1 DNA polymerase IV [Sandaracinus amylolyticus]